MVKINDKQIVVQLTFYNNYDTNSILEFKNDVDRIMMIYGNVYARFNAESRKFEIYY